mmetsp:Transcript_24898/g.69414  ORF Transcript_24898/g.69414 Transcript_24898/m.69414 type:complete len:295 (-) Transcript_24898:1086-1970(-)|eukprot:CAMPEP_0117654508 /NCGR_PEP_ID=MMETSP0804-20121206/3780_1 /TAXON_ID=1074897 /ORGANISM="Tetraselmis astigmatica, Strain CCMP880" /LENGTH=294 /DNA_ID=CAMNT_0005460791 /DNA_START=198 /DNA_END=1082 /DNA_ORIENTATION=+
MIARNPRELPKLSAVSLVVVLAISTVTVSFGFNVGAAGPKQKLQAFVFNGKDSDGSQYPYLASLRDRNDNHFCTGSLITPTVVLTAAHCILEARPVVEVHVGRTCTSCRDETGFQVGIAKTTVTHPAWTGELSLGGDVALVILERPLEGPFLKVLPVVDPEEVLVDLQFVSAAGYGLVDNYNLAETVQEAEIPFRSRLMCQNLYRAQNTILPPDAICAGGIVGVEMCQGDSGGPLILKGDTPEDHFGIGVLSGGSEGCGQGLELPSAFVNLFEYENDLKFFVPPNLWAPPGMLW